MPIANPAILLFDRVVLCFSILYIHKYYSKDKSLPVLLGIYACHRISAQMKFYNKIYIRKPRDTSLIEVL